MTKSIQVKPEVSRLINFITDIEDGKFKIPTFQRDFVWGNREKIDLFDSISKEYPIGSILLWQPVERFNHKGEIGPYVIAEYDNKNFFYILDGFQRLSTLFGCLTNPGKTKLAIDNIKLRKEFSMFYDLEEQNFNMSTSKSITNIPVYKLIDTYDFLDYLDNLRMEIGDDVKSKLLIERAKKLSSSIIDYSIPSIQIFGGTIKDAVDIFSRINSKGITISQDWMLSALTSSEDDKFNLGEILGTLLVELDAFNFGAIKRDILVQCIQTSFGRIYFDQNLEELALRGDFKDKTYQTIDGIKRTIRFLFEELLVIDKRLLPYNNQLIFLSYFFNEVPNPSDNQITKLKAWFWTTTYSNYFTIYSLSKIRKAFDHFKNFVYNEHIDPIYYDRFDNEFSTADLPKSVSAKSVRSTALILFMLNYLNDFKPVNSKRVNSLKIIYLLKGNLNHANVLPAIDYSDGSSGLEVIFNKNFSLNDLIIQSPNTLDLEKLFLSEKMLNLLRLEDYSYFYNERIGEIVRKECDFVVSLGIKYNFSETMDPWGDINTAE